MIENSTLKANLNLEYKNSFLNNIDRQEYFCSLIYQICRSQFTADWKEKFKLQRVNCIDTVIDK